MTKLTNVERTSDGWLCTFQSSWFGPSGTYWTTSGVYFYDKHGLRPSTISECTMQDRFNEKVDWFEKRLWSDDHPSPSTIARHRKAEEAQAARAAFAARHIREQGQ